MMTQGKLKQYIRTMSRKKGIPHEILYQNFFFERFLERLSKSSFNKKFILKGGFLISSLIGISERTTGDVDMTVKGYDVNEKNISDAVKEIISIKLEDNTNFRIRSIKDIRQEDKYNGYRVQLEAHFFSIKFFIKLDFSTGDVITPKPLEKDITLAISDKVIELLTYNTETVFAEKLETILTRGEASTRMKDYYDIYSIITNNTIELNERILDEAISTTFDHRNSKEEYENRFNILDIIENSEILKTRWETYKLDNVYVGNITFPEITRTLRKEI